MRLPLSSHEDRGDAKRSRFGVLDFGDNHDVPIQLRNSGGGSKEFYMPISFET